MSLSSLELIINKCKDKGIKQSFIEEIKSSSEEVFNIIRKEKSNPERFKQYIEELINNIDEYIKELKYTDIDVIKTIASINLEEKMPEKEARFAPLIVELALKPLTIYENEFNNEFFLENNFYGFTIKEFYSRIVEPRVTEANKEERLETFFDKDNIIKGFDEWFNNNYKELLVNYIEWKSYNDKSVQPSLLGVIVSNLLKNINNNEKLTLSKSLMYINDFSDKLSNDNIREIIGDELFNDYLINIKTKADYYKKFVKNIKPSIEVIDTFTTEITGILINYYNKALSNKIKSNNHYLITKKKLFNYIHNLKENWFNYITQESLKKGFNEYFFKSTSTKKFIEIITSNEEEFSDELNEKEVIQDYEIIVSNLLFITSNAKSTIKELLLRKLSGDGNE